MDEIITKIEGYYKDIFDNRQKIAELKSKIAEQKPYLWEEATGTVDQKKDYIKSQLSMENETIAKHESIIEYSYNMIEVLNLRLFSDE